MKLPSAEKELLSFAQDTAKQCLGSQVERVNQYATWRSYMFAGTEDPSRPSIYNRCGPHIDRLASFLFSPSDVRMLVEFGRRVEQAWKDRANYISEVLTEEFHGTGSDLVFGEGVPWALAYGSAFVKLLWNTEKGIDTHLVMPSQMGVWEENILGLDRQEAITHVSYISRKALARRVRGHKNEQTIMDMAHQSVKDRTDDDVDSMLHQVVIGGTQPITQGGVTNTVGVVDVFNVAPAPYLPPEVVSELVKFTEVWVLDDDRQDWTTLQFVEPGILIEPSGQKRNLFLPQRQPFQMIQPNPQHGYFWGRSELSDLWRLQDVITQRLDDITHITRLRAHPPRALIGFQGISDESKTAMGALDGLLIESSPNAKIENLAPEMPQDAYEQLQKTVEFFDDVAGFSALMQGQGEPGVRAGMHAQTLQRSASARMRDKALLLERQAGDFGDAFLELLMAKEEGAIAQGEEGKEWMLSQMPAERRVTIDSHSASPAFASDSTQLAFGLAKAGALTPEGLLLLTHPPQMQTLLKMLKDKEAAQQKLFQEHPELLQKAMGKKR